MSQVAIRNVVLVGHAGSGKTMLAEAMLVAMGVIPALGDPLLGTTRSDFDAEETWRHMSVQTALLSGRWRDTKINLLDTPGFSDFWPDVQRTMRASDAVVLVLDGAKGIEVMSQRVWREAAALGLPVFLVATKLDGDQADFARTVAGAVEGFGPGIWPNSVPVGVGADLRGVADLLSGMLDTGLGAPHAWSGDDAAGLAAHRTPFIEAATELEDALLERYLDGEELTAEELRQAWRRGVLARRLVPAFAVAAKRGLGVRALLDGLVNLAPTPQERPQMTCSDPAGGESWTIDITGERVLCAYIFKTFHDSYAGRISLFRVFSGTLHPDETTWNAHRAHHERFGRLFTLVGKEHVPLGEVVAGDIGAVAKLKDAQTGDTILAQAMAARPFTVFPLPQPPALYAVAITPKGKGDDTKLSTLLHRLRGDDPALTVTVEAGTHRTVLGGPGQTVVDVALHRLQQAGLDVDVSPPQIPYRETITRIVQAQGRHKKQTGGHGQFGDVWLRLEPLPEGSGYAYASEVVGGAVPKQFIPAVDKGVQETLAHGPLIGAPVVDVRAVLYDGSSHAVDSSEMSFKLAAHLAFKKACHDAHPILLEPMLLLQITVPEAMTGDVISDLTTRRARVQGIDTLGHLQVVRAIAPMSEMVAYAPILTSTTRGTGSYSAEFAHYEPVPPALQDKLVAAHNALVTL
ncbi:MAG: elongation factor G [Candidatus Sericytochromatia bacterium]|nr:elongation factor G [Candidatus Sericytochromatia bacterium]